MYRIGYRPTGILTAFQSLKYSTSNFILSQLNQYFKELINYTANIQRLFSLSTMF